MEIINSFNKNFENECSSKKKKLFYDKEAFKKALRNKRIIGSLLLASVLVGWFSYSFTSNRIAEKRRIADFAMIQGVALDEPHIFTRTFENGSFVEAKYTNAFDYANGYGAILDSYVPVDINGDNEKDLDLHIVVKTRYDKISPNQMFALTNIKKGSKLVLEGKIIKDEFGRPVNVVYPKNGTGVNKSGAVVVDKERGPDYIDMKNLLSIDNCKMKNTLNKNNQKIFDENFKRVYSR